MGSVSGLLQACSVSHTVDPDGWGTSRPGAAGRSEPQNNRLPNPNLARHRRKGFNCPYGRLLSPKPPAGGGFGFESRFPWAEARSGRANTDPQAARTCKPPGPASRPDPRAARTREPLGCVSRPAPDARLPKPIGPRKHKARARHAPQRPGSTPNSSVCPKPTSAPAPAIPVARASEATAAATALTTSRLNTEGMM